MLYINNLQKYYDSKSIFENISFSIPGNSLVSLTGKNGIGKTTLLNILGGISEFKGEIIFDNHNIENDYEKYMKISTLIPNTPYLYDYLTINETLDLVSKRVKSNYVTKNIEYLISDLELEPFRDTLVKNLSLGTGQKLAFIVSVIHEPKLVLIDEPFVNFDKDALKIILNFIKNYISETSGVVMFSTHVHSKEIDGLITHNLDIKNSNDLKVVNYQ